MQDKTVQWGFFSNMKFVVVTIQSVRSHLNIVTGRVVPDIVNAGKSVEIGKAQMNVYEKSWPSGFNDTGRTREPWKTM